MAALKDDNAHMHRQPLYTVEDQCSATCCFVFVLQHTLIFLGRQFKQARLAGFRAFVVAEGRRCEVDIFSGRGGVTTTMSSSTFISMSW